MIWALWDWHASNDGDINRDVYVLRSVFMGRASALAACKLERNTLVTAVVLRHSMDQHLECWHHEDGKFLEEDSALTGTNWH